MKETGKVVWLNTPIDLLKERLLKERTSRPLIRAIGDSELKSYIVRKLGERKMYYGQAHIIADEENITLDSLVQLLKHE